MLFIMVLIRKNIGMGRPDLKKNQNLHRSLRDHGRPHCLKRASSLLIILISMCLPIISNKLDLGSEALLPFQLLVYDADCSAAV